MSVKLVSYQVPVIEGIDTPEDLVAYCARVSNPANQLNTETSAKLIKYLLKHQHWSPLEMVNVCLEIKTTRDIARQILRHRSFTFQEFSTRYAEVTEFSIKEARMKDTKNRQNSTPCTDRELEYRWKTAQRDISSYAESIYKWALSKGIAKEVARSVLPEGLTMSTMYMNGSLRSWVHYCSLRCGVETQKEHRVIAEEAALVISELFPLILENIK